MRVRLWLSGLFWDPAQEPATRMAFQDDGTEWYSVEIPETNVGVSYIWSYTREEVEIVILAYYA